MKKQYLMVVCGSLAIAGSVLADSPISAPNHATTTKAVLKPLQMTCEDFLALDEVTRPRVVYWANGYNSKGVVDSLASENERTTRLIPVLVQECQREPKSSFWQKMDQETKKAFDADTHR
jgi:hypothetical protein